MDIWECGDLFDMLFIWYINIVYLLGNRMVIFGGNKW